MAHISKSYCAFLFILTVAAFSVFIATLFWLQIMQHDFYMSCAERQHFFTITEYPPRAPILDRTGKQYLALNTETIAAFIMPHELNDRLAVEQFFSDHFPHAYERLQQHSDKKFIYVARRLTPEQQQLITDAQLADIHLLQEPSRFYPVPAASCIIGLTDIDNNGLFGIEKKYDSCLKGKPQIMQVEKDARSGYYIRREMIKEGCTGTPVRLTIDATLQFLVDEAVRNTVARFNAKKGAAIVMDPATGEILACVATPSFNPQTIATLDLEETKLIGITDLYEFGSVFKVFSALAALAEKVVTPDELIDCKSSLTTYIDGRKINTPIAHGIIPFVDVIAFSNNIGIAIVAKRVGPHLYDHYRRLGFGTKTDIELPGEATGFVNAPSNWSKQSIISLSYGYEVTATLLQLACAFAMIARDGIPVHPHITIPPAEAQTAPEPLYNHETIQTIREILRRTTQYGTAKKAHVHGCTVMSKTGTANMLIDGTYVPTKNRYTCAGIVEKGSYQRIIVTFVQEADRGNLFASTVTAPLFEEIAERMLMHEKMI